MRPEHPFSRPFPERGALAASEGPCPGVAPRRRSPGEAGRGRPGPDRVPGAGPDLPRAARRRPEAAARQLGAVRTAGLFLPQQLRDVGVGCWASGTSTENMPGEDPLKSRNQGRNQGNGLCAGASRHRRPGMDRSRRPPCRPGGHSRCLRGGHTCAGRFRAKLKLILLGKWRQAWDLRGRDALGPASAQPPPRRGLGMSLDTGSCPGRTERLLSRRPWCRMDRKAEVSGRLVRALGF